MSCIAVTTTARPSDPTVPTRTTGAAGAEPDLARHADAVPPRPLRARPHFLALRPVRLGARVALHQVLGGERPVLDYVTVGVVEAPHLERIHLQLGGELVQQALEAERPLDESGGAEGRFGAVLSFAPYSTVETFGHAYSIFIGPAVQLLKPRSRRP